MIVAFQVLKTIVPANGEKINEQVCSGRKAVSGE